MKYSEIKAEIVAAPMTYLPGLLVAVVKTCLEKKVFKPGGASRIAKEVEDEALGQPKSVASGSSSVSGSAAYGVIDPDYARIYTVIRCLAWQEGYAAMMHGSFTRDLDIVAVPWTDKACEPEHLVARVLASNLNLTEATPGKPGSKPHSRRVWTLMLPEFGDPRFVDLSICQPQNGEVSEPAASGPRKTNAAESAGSLH